LYYVPGAFLALTAIAVNVLWLHPEAREGNP